MSNWLAVVLSFVYVFAVLGIAEGLRKAFKLPPEFTRKVVHIGVGMWAFGTAALFTDKWFAIIPPASFIVLNYISYRRGTFAAMETGDTSNLGTVYFPIAFVALIILFFDISKPLMVMLLMPLTWGDSMAAVIGKRFGRRHYTVLGSRRSVEGTVAMFAFSTVAVAGASLVFGAPAEIALVTGLVLAVAATIVEAVSPGGLDNLLIPASGVVVYLLYRVLLVRTPLG